MILHQYLVDHLKKIEYVGETRSLKLLVTKTIICEKSVFQLYLEGIMYLSSMLESF